MKSGFPINLGGATFCDLTYTKYYKLNCEQIA